MKADYAAAGIKVMVSAFGSSEVPTSSGADPVALAHKMAQFVKDYGLDGIDVDYEDFGAIGRVYQVLPPLLKFELTDPHTRMTVPLRTGSSTLLGPSAKTCPVPITSSLTLVSVLFLPFAMRNPEPFAS